MASTDEVYGSISEPGCFDEHAPLAPSSPYAASKAGADLLALAYHRTYGLDVVVTRASNTYGPYQLPEKLIPLATLRALAAAPVPVYGDGLNVRDWLHVGDHCAGLVLAAERGAAGRAYNLAGGAERTNLAIVRCILRAAGRSESLVRFVADRPGHDRRYALDASRARAELGFAPAVSLDDGLEATVAWYASNAAWCAAVHSESHREHLARTYGDLDATAAAGAGRGELDS